MEIMERYNEAKLREYRLVRGEIGRAMLAQHVMTSAEHRLYKRMWVLKGILSNAGISTIFVGIGISSL